MPKTWPDGTLERELSRLAGQWRLAASRSDVDAVADTLERAADELNETIDEHYESEYDQELVPDELLGAMETYREKAIERSEEERRWTSTSPGSPDRTSLE